MKKYLTLTSALEHYPFPLALQFFGGNKEAEKTQYLIMSKQNQGSPKGCKYYRCSQNLPKGSLTRYKGQEIISPALLYLLLSRNLDLWESIILGNLMCAYTDGPNSKQFINKKYLSEQLSLLKGIYGYRKCKRALAYVEDGACSIMEVFIHILISLPIKLGGLNIPGGTFNHKIVLDPKASRALGKKHLFADYCFPQEKIIYEYQGSFHNQTMDQDNRRSMVLQSLDYQVIMISKGQIYDRANLKILLENILKNFRKRHRTTSNSYMIGLNRIYDLLPRIDPCEWLDPGQKDLA